MGILVKSEASGLTAAKMVGAAVTVAAFLAWVFVDLTPPVQLGAGLVLAAAGICSLQMRPRRRVVLAVLSVAVSTRYIVWRATESLGGESTVDALAAGLLFAAELFAFASLLGGLFQTAAFKRRRPIPLTDKDPASLPTVDVYIPTYNESVDVVRATAIGAMAIDYARKSVWILDDGRRESMRILAQELGCGYLIRPDNKGAKAGNLNAALTHTSGELIAIFDADHVPTRGFLQATVGFFLQDPKLALVQTPHHFVNADPFERNLHLDGRVPPEQHFFYHTIQVGNDFWNSAFFCGSCALLSRKALLEVGGVPTDTVTEDAACSLQMHARGWNSAYLDVPLAAGLATESFGAHVIQRMRWARGMAQIFRLHNPLFHPGLTWPQRINYACASWHFFGGAMRVVFLVAAPAYLIFDVHPVSADVWELACYAVPHLILIWTGGADAHRNTRHSFWSEVYEIAVAPYTAAVVVVALVAPKRGVFRVTAKGEVNDALTYDLSMAFPVLGLLAMTVLSLGMMPSKMANNPGEIATIAMASLWCVYNLFMLVAAATVALERPQRRTAHRIKRSIPLTFSTDEGTSRGRSIDLSLTGGALELIGTPAPGPIRVHLVGMPASLVLQGEIIHSRATPMGVIAGVRWTGLDTEAHRALVSAIYADTDGWMEDRFAHDRPFASMLSVVAAPIRALLRGPAWGATSSARTEGLVPETRKAACFGCGAIAGHVLGRCERCGEVVPFLTAEPAEMRWVRPPEGRKRFVYPAVLTGAGLLATVLLSPLLERDGHVRVDYVTRTVQLREAEVEIAGLADELRARAQLSGASPSDWTLRLASLRTRHGLDGARARWADVANAELLLRSATLSLDSAAVELGDSVRLEARLGGISTTLRQARTSLEGA